MKMTGETKFFVGVIAGTLALLIGAVVFFSRPAKEVPLETLVPKDAWVAGAADLKATLVEFSDFQCPACGTAYPIVKEVAEKYKDELRLVYRHFPLESIHPNARRAAEAAEAAGVQGKFWEMHDQLFKNQANLSQETINGIALDLKLDMDKFTTELTNGTYSAKVQKDIDDGNTMGINSTPTFFLNGKKLSLFSFSDLETEVKKALGK